MRTFRFVVCLIIEFSFQSVHAQVDSLILKEPEYMLTEVMQENLEMQSEASGAEDEDYSELFENLVYFRNHQLNINTAGKEGLQELGLLNPIQINALLEHIHINGPLLSIYELQSIEYFDIPSIRTILPYVRVITRESDTYQSLKDLLKNTSQQFDLRYARVLETQKGYTLPNSRSANSGSRFVGSPDQVLASYQSSIPNLTSLGFSGRKDPGERFSVGQSGKGFDFYSMHLFIQTKGIIKALAFGDFAMSFGQGLVAWSGLALSKTAEACIVERTGAGLKPYTSSSKTRNLRGGGVSLRFGLLEATAFYSYKLLDATVSDTSIGGKVMTVRTIQTTGIHATPSELQSANTLPEETAGGHLALSLHKLVMGVTAMQTRFGADVEPKPVPYNLFEFRGKELMNAGADYNLVIRNLIFFGEGALSKDQREHPNTAFLQGVLVAADPRMSFTILYRNYSPAYHSFFSNAFSEGGKTSNEQGIYWGLTLKPRSQLSISVFCDYVSYPWLKYRVDAPVTGNDFFAKISWNPDKRTEIYLFFRRKLSALDPPAANDPDEINFPLPGIQTNYRLNIITQPSTVIRLKTRVELIWKTDSVQSLEQGFLLSASFSIKPKKRPFSLTGSYTIFDTPSGNTRIYAYEQGVPGTYSTPSYSGRGSRFTGLIQTKTFRKIQISLSFTRTFYDDRQVIGIGTLNQINGRHKSEVQCNLRMKF